MRITTSLASITVLALAVVAIVAAVSPWALAPDTSAGSLQQQAATPTPTSTPALFTGVYRNTTHGFSMTLPEGWVAIETGELFLAVSVEGPAGSEFVVAEVFVFGLEDPQLAAQWLMGEVATYGREVLSESAVDPGPGATGYQAHLGWRRRSTASPPASRWRSLLLSAPPGATPSFCWRVGS